MGVVSLSSRQNKSSITGLSHVKRMEMNEIFHKNLIKRPLVMGVLNITPDSFSDGGKFNFQHTAILHAQNMVDQGVDIIDIGAESTRPNATPLSVDEEKQRLEAILPALVQGVESPLSIDTYKADIARYACEQGVSVINDVKGLDKDTDMMQVVADMKVTAIAMRNSETVDERVDIIDEIARFVDDIAFRASRLGISEEKIIIDPGIGFGTTREQDFEIIRKISLIKSFGFRVLIGLSRKRMIGAITGREVKDRLAGTLSANLISLYNGADIIRVHDVAEHIDALKTFQTLVE